MNGERKRILKMLEEGKIDVEEANKLLSTLEESEPEAEYPEVETKAQEEATALKIIVVEEGQEEVNISVPLSLVKMLKGFVPGKAKKKLDEKGIDLEGLMDKIAEGTFNGKLVDIKDGDSHVEIKLVK